MVAKVANQPTLLFNKETFSQIAYTKSHQLVDCNPDTDPVKFLRKYCNRIDWCIKKELTQFSFPDIAG